MKKIIVHGTKLKQIINEDQQFWIIYWATYRSSLNKDTSLENHEYENEMIKNIQFFNVLEMEINSTEMSYVNYELFYKNLQEAISNYNLATTNNRRADSNFWSDKIWSLLKSIDNDNKRVKFSNQEFKKIIIDNNLKTDNEKQEYEKWKKNYYENIHKKIMKNSVEQGINALEYFKYEINSVDLQNQPSTNGYRSPSPSI